MMAMASFSWQHVCVECVGFCCAPILRCWNILPKIQLLSVTALMSSVPLILALYVHLHLCLPLECSMHLCLLLHLLGRGSKELCPSSPTFWATLQQKKKVLILQVTSVYIWHMNSEGHTEKKSDESEDYDLSMTHFLRSEALPCKGSLLYA